MSTLCFPGHCRGRIETKSGQSVLNVTNLKGSCLTVSPTEGGLDFVTHHLNWRHVRKGAYVNNLQQANYVLRNI